MWEEAERAAPGPVSPLAEPRRGPSPPPDLDVARPPRMNRISSLTGLRQRRGPRRAAGCRPRRLRHPHGGTGSPKPPFHRRPRHRRSRRWNRRRAGGGSRPARSRAEEALRRMVRRRTCGPTRRPGPAERTRVRDEWPVPRAELATVPPRRRLPPKRSRSRSLRAPAAPPVADDPIIPWLEPPVAPAAPGATRPAVARSEAR